jgi:hypothetical protein
MVDPFAALRRELERSVLEARGSTQPSLRRRIASRRDLPDDLRALVDKIYDRAYSISDEEIAAVRERYDDDAIFEVAAAAAIGAAGIRLDAALAALAGAEDAPREG